MKKRNCKICTSPTLNAFNINFKMIYICESCAESVFIQQAKWYVKSKA